MESKTKHLVYVPFTGLGLYGGFRGNRWLKNRIEVFEHFTLQSLLAQTNKNFTLWFSWRPEEKRNPYVQGFMEFMDQFTEFKTVHTFHGVCFWDDKYPDEVAKDRLLTSLHGTMGELTNVIGECDYVLMTIQPSDDCYHRNAIAGIQAVFQQTDYQAFGFKQGYMMNYSTKEVAMYNPNTNPPFFTIKFPRDVFIDPLRHSSYTGPYKSHEYIGEKLKYGVIDDRSFIVGTHGENISTTFVHPFKGDKVGQDVLKDFGLYDVPALQIKTSIRKKILRKLPHKVQRKLRYWLGERFWAKIYEYLRS